jgi:tRNA(Ile)-lysidine synthase
MLLEKIRKTIRAYDLFKKGDTVLIGVSGGPDSLALLYALHCIKKEHSLKLFIAHLDHMLRKDSSSDAEFVKKTASKLGIPVSSGRINVKAIAEKGSLEEIARNARLGFLFQTAKKIKADKIALGHNLDDRAETVLMRMLRGSGMYGLSGILPKRMLYGFCIVRPLIETRRKDIENFLKRKKIKPRIDISNSQDIYFRNKIRNKLLPFLEKDYNPNIKEVLSNTAEIIGYDYDYLNLRARNHSTFLKSKTDIKKFLALHPSMQRSLLRLHINRLKKDTRGIEFRHIKEIEDMLLNRPVGSIVDLPGNICVSKTRKYFCFYRK